ncbi:Or46a [Trypoxylus dichotomus]
MTAKLPQTDILQLGVEIFRIIGEDVRFTSGKIYFYRVFNVAVCLFSLYFILANCFRETGGVLVKTLEGAITIFHVLTKYVAFMYGKSGISSIIDDKAKFWNPQEIDTKLASNADALYTYTKLMQKALLIAFVTSAHFYFLKPFFNSNDAFPFNVWINSESLPLNVAVLILQYYCICIVVPTVLCYDIIYFSICVHLIVQLRLLKCRLAKATHDIRSELRACIEHHQLLSGIFIKMQQIYSWILLVQYLITLGIICVQLYILNSGQLNIADATELLLYLTSMYSEFGYYSIPVEEMSFEFSDISNAVYKSSWYERNVDTRKSLLTIMIYARVPKYLNGGGLITVNTDAFGSVCRKSFSMYLVLKNLLK